MDIEKMVNSKWYSAFDWIYKLIIMNMISLFIPMLFGLIPFLIFHNSGQGIYAIIAIVLTVFAFLPCYITNFQLIKIFKEEKQTGIFKEYIKNLWYNFKKIYLISIIFDLVITLLIISAYIYWNLLESETFRFNAIGITYIIGFWFVVMCLFFIFCAFLHFQLVINYFKMSKWNYIKASFYMEFKYFFKTLIFIAFFSLPIILVFWFMTGTMLSLWTLLGITGPQFLIYISGRPIYWYLANNLDDIKNEDKYEFKGENDDETRN